MSLINDALKRATSRQPTTIAIDPEPPAPMQPVEYRRRGLPWYFFPALFAILAAACWFIVKGVQASLESSSPVSKPITVQARELAPEPSALVADPSPGVNAPRASAIPAATTTPASPSNSRAPEPSPTATDTPAAPTPAPAPAPAPEPPKPAYRLQGIFFRPGNPSALINGRSVWIGSRVDGATVKTITRDSLTIEVNGQATVLNLE